MESYGVYVLLTRQPTDGKYHWGLYIPFDARSGMRAHTVNRLNPINGRFWMLEHGRTDTTATSTRLVLALKVGSVNGWTYNTFQRVVAKDEMMAESKGDEEEFTCRVYVLRVLRELHREKVINCPDVEAVEQEAIDLANGHVCEIDRGRGHLVVASKYSA